MEELKLVVDYATLGILGMMSVIALAYGVERFFYYRSVNLDHYMTKNQAEAELTKNLTAISVIGSNAPYVGLLGTVAGIMVVFYEIGQSGGMEPSTVIIGLSLALKATALGLLVAIPSMMIYSACLRKVDLLMGKFEDARA
ncbi:TonB-system energizer ExbB [Sulfuricurvum sp. RIFCSPLOWO2_12_FULL_43_24]|uniref:TonB-system energizer ExbB n=1 Tax=Sulfuricurvum sp. RIFCSPLOWO2_12_FULL_43_24 TaxID=1802247 RepID=UPI0008C2A226|nr:TonB-system energizer ExbB [Sulfuricurvum sp. RIFCSPLOWO2_12_FULL_43_24]OHD88984.1 MAG: TonB-system energizer ExbB [Sulfuricurvum sp. RIFCSPLOWO2_12_FULL_43_24]OHD92363.1 MAG: TonB-system energizer ExbB [Sulfuricurvum sp. RIFCSPLOWO2_12_43_5]